MTTIRGLGLGAGGAAAACLLAVAVARGQDAPATPPDDATVVDTSYDAPDGGRVLRQSIVVPAGAAEVWTTWTTGAGWQSFAVPVAHVDFRLGGIIETSYRPDAQPGDPANIKNRVLAYLPMRMLAIQAIQAPPGFPAPELLPQLFTVVELEALAEQRVRVTVSGVGYRPDEKSQGLLKFFTAGNAWTLRKLRERFVSGPVDWAKALRPAAPGSK